MLGRLELRRVSKEAHHCSSPPSLILSLVDRSQTSCLPAESGVIQLCLLVIVDLVSCCSANSASTCSQRPNRAGGAFMGLTELFPFGSVVPETLAQ